MTKTFWTVTEIIEQFQVDEHFLEELVAEEIISVGRPENQTEKVFLSDELEKLRLAKILMEEMDVNLPGVEIILRMRQSMFDMRRQFDEILKDMAQTLTNR